MASFTVEVRRTGEIVLETDDWVEAQQRALTSRRLGLNGLEWLVVRGTHPSHGWDEQRPRRCRSCAGWDNGSYGSQAPCGYDWNRSLAAALEDEMKARGGPSYG